VESGVETVEDDPRKPPLGLVCVRHHDTATGAGESTRVGKNKIRVVGVRRAAGDDPWVGLLCAQQR
jgi:hypothetical protein